MNIYPSENIHLPPHRASFRIAQNISFTGGIVILLTALAIFCDFLFKLNIFEKTFVNIPTIIAFVAAGAEIFLYKKNKKFQLLGIPLFVIGLFTILSIYTNFGINFLSTDNLKSGMVFLIIGLGFIISILKIPHRYHFMQLTILIALCVVLFGFLESLYQFLSLKKIAFANSIEYLLLLIMCQSAILSKPNRGFIGIFTTDSRSSQLARMSLVYYAILPATLGIFVLIIGEIEFLTPYTSLALLTVLAMITSVIITWINVKLLYPSEVEHFLMKESLRVNNISLELNANDLSTKVVELEEAKKTIVDKLENRQTLADLVDSTG